MSSPFFIPPARIVPSIDVSSAVPLSALLAAAGAECKASGAWTERQIVVDRGAPGLLEREPGDWAAVRIGVVAKVSARSAARFAVLVLAYGIMDLVARQSIAGLPWARPTVPRGRPRASAPLSAAERQRRWRSRHRGGSRPA